MSGNGGQSAVNNPPRSVGELFAAHRARVYRWAMAHGLRHEESLDVVQEAFTRMLKALPFCASEGSQIAWLRRTASNLAIDARRGPRARVRALPPALLGSGDARDDVEEHRERLRAGIGSLSELQRLVLIAKVVDGMTFAETARQLGIATPTAKTHFSRAIAAMRGAMGAQASEGVRA